MENKREKLIEIVNDMIADNDYNGNEDSRVGLDKSIERILFLFEIENWELVRDLEER